MTDILFIFRTLPQVPAWAFMWLLALAIFAACKWMTWRRALADARCQREESDFGIHGASVCYPKPAVARSLGYLLAWVGMDGRAFLLSARPRSKPNTQEWLFAGIKTVFGAALVWAIVRLVPSTAPLLRGWIGLTGMVFLLHFGLFHLLALVWQRAGVDAQPIMRAPVLAASVAEFWGRRWNLAFHQLAHELVFRPLRRKFGLPVVTLAVFLLSGLVHEAVISIPARGGYGGPTLYFLLQALAVLWERYGTCQKSMHMHKGLAPAIGSGFGWQGRLWTLACTAGPLGLLFHPPFVTRVILPFLQVIGAL